MNSNHIGTANHCSIHTYGTCFIFERTLFYFVVRFVRKIYPVIFVTILFPRDATQRAVMPQYIVCLSVRLSVCDVQASWSHRLEYLENHYTAE